MKTISEQLEQIKAARSTGQGGNILACSLDHQALLDWAKQARSWLLLLEDMLAGIKPGEPYYQGGMDTRTSGLSVLISELPE